MGITEAARSVHRTPDKTFFHIILLFTAIILRIAFCFTYIKILEFRADVQLSCKCIYIFPAKLLQPA